MAVLLARGLRKRFGPAPVLRGVDLDLEPGRCLALFGPNGAGKTTLLRILAGLTRPDGGGVGMAAAPGEEEEGPRSPDYRRRLGYLGHRLLLYPHLSGRRNLLFQAALFDLPDRRRRVEAALEEVGLRRRGDDPLHAYSRGMSQRLALARAVLHEPEFLVLDEPFSGLDPDAARALAEMLVRRREAGRSILLASHDMVRGLGIADRVAVLHGGRLVHAAEVEDRDAGRFEALYAGLVAEGRRGA